MNRLSFTLAALLLAAGSTSVSAQSPDSLLFITHDGDTRLRLDSDGSTTISGEFTGTGTVSLPMAGPGSRLMWIPGLGALRVGTVTGTQWDPGNIGEHSIAVGLDSRASGSYSAAFGLRAIAAQTSAFAAGEDVTASGAASVALGYHAHTNARQGSFVFADRASVDTLRAGVNHSANWRTSGGFRIFTTSNLSTGVTIQSGASVSNWGQASAVISTSTGAVLTTGGVWQNASDVNRKHAFAEVSGEEILTRLRELPIRSWTYLVEDDSIRHLGPTSQDFRAAFGLGTDELSIGTVDADGVALSAAQALERRSADQAEEIHSQAARIAALEAANAGLIERLETLERLLSPTSPAR